MNTWKGLEIPEGWHVYRDAGTHACLTNRAGDVQTLYPPASYPRCRSCGFKHTIIEHPRRCCACDEDF